MVMIRPGYLYLFEVIQQYLPLITSYLYFVNCHGFTPIGFYIVIIYWFMLHFFSIELVVFQLSFQFICSAKTYFWGVFINALPVNPLFFVYYFMIPVLLNFYFITTTTTTTRIVFPNFSLQRDFRLPLPSFFVATFYP